MLSLHTNAAALSTTNAVTNTQRSLSSSLTKLGTGYRINSAMDDAAGLQIATRLDAQTRGMAVAMRNTQNGISMMQTAEGAFDEVSNMLLRMKDLATEAANGSTTADDKTALQSEFQQLGKEVNNILSNTKFGGEQLLDETAGKFASGSVTFQIGASSDETMDVDLTASFDKLFAGSASSGSIDSFFGETGAISTNLSSGAGDAIDALDDALTIIGEIRSGLGAAANRLDHVHNNLSNMSTNTTSAKSRIMDVDFATETASMTSQQLLLQAGTSMLKQSGSMSQLALSLLN